MAEIFFRRQGKGKPFILIHGFCETHEIWNPVFDQLAHLGEVFAIDLPGFGQSNLPPTPFSIVDISESVLRWVKKQGIDQPMVVGHSLGGYVALGMVAQQPEVLGGLCLFHSTPYPDVEERKANRNRVMAFVSEHGVDPWVDTYVPGLFLNKKHAAIPQVDVIARKTPLATLLAYTAAMRDRPSTAGAFKQFARPVLVIAGKGDTIIPVASALEFGQLPPTCKVVVVEEAGHMAMFEAPQQAVRALAEFAEGV